MRDGQGKHAHLFTLRVWPETAGKNQTAWRGRILHVASGESQDIRDWDALVEFLKHLTKGENPL